MPTASNTEPGTVLFDRYRVVRRIAAGGMGTVFEARDVVLDQPVALKRVSYAALPDDLAAETRERTLREARNAAQMRGDPHVVAIYDVQVSDGDVWLVLEYLPSRSLAELTAGRTRIDVATVAAIGAPVARGLAAAHGRGITHRDVKPGNILIAHEGAPGAAKLTDFGISHAEGESTLTATGQVSGTPAYMAREVARGEDATPASDVFSLGATLYAAVEGIGPFGAHGNPRAMVYRVANDPVRPPEVAGPLGPLLMAMMDDEPARRPDAATVAGQLESIAAHRTRSAPAGPDGVGDTDVRLGASRSAGPSHAEPSAGPSVGSGHGPSGPPSPSPSHPVSLPGVGAASAGAHAASSAPSPSPASSPPASPSPAPSSAPAPGPPAGSVRPAPGAPQRPHPRQGHGQGHGQGQAARHGGHSAPSPQPHARPRATPADPPRGASPDAAARLAPRPSGPAPDAGATAAIRSDRSGYPGRRRSVMIGAALGAVLAVALGVFGVRALLGADDQPPASPRAISGDPRAADPCALLDMVALQRFGAVAPSPGAPPSGCRVDVTAPDQPPAQLIVKYDRGAQGDGRTEQVGDLAVQRGRPVTGAGTDARSCMHTIGLPDGNQVLLRAYSFTDAAAPCDIAGLGLDSAVAALQRDGIRYAPERATASVLARADACQVLDPAALGRAGIGTAAFPGYGAWSCSWGTSESYASVSFGGTTARTGVAGVAGPPIAGRPTYVDEQPDRCSVTVAHVAPPGGDELLETVTTTVRRSGPAPVGACATATELATNAESRIPAA